MINRDVTADEVQRLESLVTYLEEQDSQSLLHKQVRDVTTASKIRGEWWPVSSISSRFVRPRSLAYRSPHTISSLWKTEFGLWFVRLYLFWAICDNKCGPFLAGVCGCWWFMPNLLRSEDIGQVHSLFTRILQVSITCDKNDWFFYISVLCPINLNMLYLYIMLLFPH